MMVLRIFKKSDFLKALVPMLTSVYTETYIDSTHLCIFKPYRTYKITVLVIKFPVH